MEQKKSRDNSLGVRLINYPFFFVIPRGVPVKLDRMNGKSCLLKLFFNKPFAVGSFTRRDIHNEISNDQDEDDKGIKQRVNGMIVVDDD